MSLSHELSEPAPSLPLSLPLLLLRLRLLLRLLLRPRSRRLSRLRLRLRLRLWRRCERRLRRLRLRLRRCPRRPGAPAIEAAMVTLRQRRMSTACRRSWRAGSCSSDSDAGDERGRGTCAIVTLKQWWKGMDNGKSTHMHVSGMSGKENNAARGGEDRCKRDDTTAIDCAGAGGGAGGALGVVELDEGAARGVVGVGERDVEGAEREDVAAVERLGAPERRAVEDRDGRGRGRVAVAAVVAVVAVVEAQRGCGAGGAHEHVPRGVLGVDVDARVHGGDVLVRQHHVALRAVAPERERRVLDVDHAPARTAALVQHLHSKKAPPHCQGKVLWSVMSCEMSCEVCFNQSINHSSNQSIAIKRDGMKA